MHYHSCAIPKKLPYFSCLACLIPQQMGNLMIFDGCMGSFFVAFSGIKFRGLGRSQTKTFSFFFVTGMAKLDATKNNFPSKFESRLHKKCILPRSSNSLAELPNESPFKLPQRRFFSQCGRKKNRLYRAQGLPFWTGNFYPLSNDWFS